jgi:hypothetical protein
LNKKITQEGEEEEGEEEEKKIKEVSVTRMIEVTNFITI